MFCGFDCLPYRGRAALEGEAEECMVVFSGRADQQGLLLWNLIRAGAVSVGSQCCFPISKADTSQDKPKLYKEQISWAVFIARVPGWPLTPRS